MRSNKLRAAFIAVFLIMIAAWAFAQDEIKPLIDHVSQAESGMTLWALLKAGGGLMIVLVLLSVLLIGIAIYDLVILKPSILCPRDFAEDIIKKLEQGKSKTVREICLSEDNILDRIVLAGIEKKTRGALAVKEAMETCARSEVSKLWINVSYLSDIATVAPLVGLLGTVLGMISAFNVVAFQMTLVKPILLAGGIAKAMVATAGGLFVAIPAMLLYSYFRNKVQEVAAQVEMYSSDIVKLVSES